MAAAEQKKSYQVVKQFEGVNTKANRTAIKDTEFSWLENAMPIGFANLKVVPTSSSLPPTLANNCAVLSSVNLGLNDYILSFGQDGSFDAYNVENGFFYNVAPANTFTPSIPISAATASQATLGHTLSGYVFLTINGTITGTFSVGQLITGTGVPSGCYITSVISGSGGAGSTYLCNLRAGPGFSVGPELMTGNTVPPSNASVSVSQWKNQYALIADPKKGYFLWDGTNLTNVGSVGGIGIVNGGNNYTSAPTITISAPNQTGGTQATALCTITNTAGQVSTITVTATGSGYNSVPSVTIDKPPAPGVQATAVAGIAGGNVVTVSVVNPGSGYTSAPGVTLSGGGYTSPASATASIDTGSVNAIFITNAGSGYTSPPTITFSGGGGTSANAIASLLTFAQGTVAVNVTNGGTGYINAANTVVSFSGGGGTGAAGTAIISGQQVTQVIMTNAGSGYTSNPTVTISGGGATGNNVATLQGVATTDYTSAVASFSGRVWLSQGRTVYYSGAGSVSDFISVSSGDIVLADSTLHGNVTGMLAANNFLYVFGDDSINVFSDVRVTNTGTTLFTNTNISASVGSRRPKAIFPYFRSVLFMNDYGIYALVGSTTTKISDALDGIFPYIDFSQPVYGGQGMLNNILVAVFNFTYAGPGGGGNYASRQVQAVFFDKKWFLTSQGSVGYITSVPVYGVNTIYGAYNTGLVKLYADNQSNISSYIQTALLPMGDPIRTKQALKFGIEGSADFGYPITVTVDSEQLSSAPYTLAGSAVYWVNNSNNTVQWINNSSLVVAWNQTGSPYWLYKSDAAQWGKYIGLTITQTQPQFVLNTVEFEHELRTRF